MEKIHKYTVTFSFSNTPMVHNFSVTLLPFNLHRHNDLINYQTTRYSQFHTFLITSRIFKHSNIPFYTLFFRYCFDIVSILFRFLVSKKYRNNINEILKGDWPSKPQNLSNNQTKPQNRGLHL